MTYPELVEFCGNERQAFRIAELLPYRDLDETTLAMRVIDLMVTTAERISGPVKLEYLGGIRRDQIREQNRHQTQDRQNAHRFLCSDSTSSPGRISSLRGERS
jgi:hypothetical protein